ncbi:MAG: hypothetical protein U0446_00060 [Dehalococcoidia bacterium]
MRWTGAAAYSALLLLATAFASPALVEGQTPTPAASFPAGRVSGTITNGTAGAPGIADVRIQLLALTGDGKVTSTDSTAQDGRFSFAPPANPNVTYVLRATYKGVSYLIDPPILLSPELTTEEREITVYETTDVAPPLRVDSTVVSVQGLDRDLGELSLQREDQVTNPTDRVYVGSADHVTLRLPAPDGVTGLGATEDLDAEVRLDGLVATTTQALRPGQNLVVTRYVVGYDQGADSYRLRVTTALPTDEMQIWVPARFVNGVQAGAGAIMGANRTLQGEQWRVVQRLDAANEGDSIVASLSGLTRANESNPFLGFPGAMAASAVALTAVIVGVVVLSRVRPRLRGLA